MKTITYDIERNLERSHWWFVGRRKLLEFLFSSLCIQEDFLVVDIGCGVGSNLKPLKSMCLTLIGVDSEIYSLSPARKRLSAVPLVSENEINFSLLNSLLERIFSLEPYLLKYFRFPFGVSIFRIAR